MSKRNLIWVVIVLAMAGVLVGVLQWRQESPGRSDDGAFRGPREMYELIRTVYVHDTDPDRLEQAAVQGMMGELDEFSTYFPPEAMDALTGRLMGREVGLGLRLRFEDGRAHILGPLPGTPAQRARLYAGQELLAVEGSPVATLSEAQVRNMLDGDTGEDVELTVRAPDGTLRDLTLVREQYDVETVRGLCRNADGRWIRMLPDTNLLYIRITEFCPNTPGDLQDVLRSHPSPAGVILDLRGNPGGLLENGVAVADEFLQDGLIVTCVGRSSGEEEYHARSDTSLPEAPLVVLVDRDTASAAELLAETLAAHGRALVLGERTRGKGCVQSMIRLPEPLGQVNLTTRVFLVAGCRGISKHPGQKDWGVAPHIGIDMLATTREHLAALWKQAEVLPAPQDNDADDAGLPDSPTPLAETIIHDDPVLHRAITILRLPKQFDTLLEIHAAEEAEKTTRAKQALEKQRRSRESDDSYVPGNG